MSPCVPNIVPKFNRFPLVVCTDIKGNPRIRGILIVNTRELIKICCRPVIIFCSHPILNPHNKRLVKSSDLKPGMC